MKKNRREAQNLVLMFSSSILVGLIIVVGLVYYFGSSGTYLLRNVLISPQNLERLTFTDQKKFVHNKIEFVRVEKSGREWGRFAVSPQSYAEFYKIVANLRSLPKVRDEFIQQFERVAPSTLTIFGGERTIFQQVEFLDEGEIFRVRMRNPRRSEEEWIYFRSPGIYSMILELFAPPLAT